MSLVLVAGFIVADPNTGKTLLGLQPIDPIDAATREATGWSVPLRPVVCDLRPAARPIHAGPASVARRRFGQSPRRPVDRRPKDLYRNHRQVAVFLPGRMLYADGLGAVFAFGGIYAASVFSWGAMELGLFGIISLSPARLARALVARSTIA